MRKRFLCIAACVLVIGCKPTSPATSSGVSATTAIPSVLEPTADPADKHDVANLSHNPPPSGQPIEIDVYFSGATMIPHPGGFPPPPDQIACPRFYGAALTDRPFLADLTVLNSIGGNILPDDTPWLIAVTPDMLKPGVWQLPQLPYYARLRGHLGESVLAHCEHADRIFVVEQVVQIYQDKPAKSPDFPRQLPDDFATWSHYHDPRFGFSVSNPSDWQIKPIDDVTWNLRAPQWPDLPIVVRVHDGETHLDQYDPASTPPL